MLLRSLSVEGFRSLLDVSVDPGQLTVEIGPNGSGKSSFLTAIRLLMDPALKVAETDFSRDSSGLRLADEIKITGVFSLFPEEEESFRSILVDNTLTITRVFAESGKGEYKCRRKSVRAFAQIRAQETGHRDNYNALVATGQFPELERANNKTEALSQMEEWETSNPASLEDVLDRFDRLEEVRARCPIVFVGATADPIAEVQPSKGTLRLLLDSLVDLEGVHGRLQEAVQQSTTRMTQIIERESPTLELASNEISNSIAPLSPGVQIRMRWNPPVDMQATLPTMTVTVVGADGIETDLGVQGHGTQRSVLLALLAALAETERPRVPKQNVLFVIEEPEVFQHPLSARHLARTLFELTKRGFQVLCSTHSPFFVHPNWLEGVCLFRRTPSGLETSIHPLSLGAIARRLENAGAGSAFTEQSTRARLMQIVDANKTEGLFARYVILVEGIEDASLLRAAGSIADAHLDEAGIAIVAADGKPNLPMLLALFQEAGIPVYVIFDLDRESDVTDADRNAERTLMGLVGRQDLDLQDTVLEETFACCRTTLAALVRDEIGPRFEELFASKRAEFGFKGDQGKKSQAVLESMLKELAGEGLTSSSLTSLVEKIASRVSPTGAQEVVQN